MYKIDPDGLGEFEVFCDQKTAGGGWTVIQRRQDGSVDFYKGWNDYKLGFGNLNGEFWLGLDKIHRLTASKHKKLRVDLEATAGTILLAEYGSFAVANEKAKYQLTVGGYSGENSPQMTANGLRLTTVLFPLDYADIYGESCFFSMVKTIHNFFSSGNAGDSLAEHNGMFFTTKDSDNDKWSKNCASSFKGAWWYKNCHSSNLNGLYLYSKFSSHGMNWVKWKNNNLSFKRSEMKIRPKNF